MKNWQCRNDVVRLKAQTRSRGFRAVPAWMNADKLSTSTFQPAREEGIYGDGKLLVYGLWTVLWIIWRRLSEKDCHGAQYDGIPSYYRAGHFGHFGLYFHCPLWPSACFQVSLVIAHENKLFWWWSRKTPIAFLYRAVWVYFPNGIAYVDSRLFGGRLVRAWNQSGKYILHENHPLVLVNIQLQ